MNAHKFVAEHGIKEAKRVLDLASDAWAYDAEQDHFFDSSDLQDGYSIEHCNDCFLVQELKQVVESVEIVERSGGFESVKAAITNYRASGDKVTFSSLEKRLADYELVESYKQVKCEVLDMVDVSPSCEVINEAH
ncbi:hypothetical protein [Acinetobacter soli]|uniref:hypothetical protein n=1 Tax=Acinetobacter soli TaxID=487316 RepID=UPI00124FB030|nr:hypothetical protein [Acinetobacter soli]